MQVLKPSLFLSFLFHFTPPLKKNPTRRAQETGKIVVLLVSCLEKNRVSLSPWHLAWKWALLLETLLSFRAPFPSCWEPGCVLTDGPNAMQTVVLISSQMQTSLTRSPKPKKGNGHWTAALRPCRVEQKGPTEAYWALGSQVSWEIENHQAWVWDSFFQEAAVRKL